MYQLKKSLLLVGAVFLLVASGCVNRPPTLNCVTGSGSLTVTEGNSVKIVSNAQDLDKNDVLSYDWSSPDGGKIKTNNGADNHLEVSSVTFDSTGLNPGKYTVGLTVRDKKLNTAVCAVDLSVQKNKQSPIVSCGQSNTNVIVGESTSLQASASDPNNDAINYQWSVDGDNVSNNQSSFEFGSTGRSLGRHTVALTVTDVDGMSASCNFNVLVNRPANLNPTVSLTLNKQAAYAGETITATVSASDPHNDPLTYSWVVDGQNRSGNSSGLSLNTSGMSGGSHSVSVTVQDDRNASASDTKSLSITEKIVIQINQLRPDNIAKAQLDEIALKMQQNPQLQAIVTGHTDDRGSEEGNERYGQKRSEAVKSYLSKQHNMDESRVETVSAGESQPRSDNSNTQGRQENRRVVVELSVP